MLSNRLKKGKPTILILCGLSIFLTACIGGSSDTEVTLPPTTLPDVYSFTVNADSAYTVAIREDSFPSFVFNFYKDIEENANSLDPRNSFFPTDNRRINTPDDLTREMKVFCSDISLFSSFDTQNYINDARDISISFFHQRWFFLLINSIYRSQSIPDEFGNTISVAPCKALLDNN